MKVRRQTRTVRPAWQRFEHRYDQERPISSGLIDNAGPKRASNILREGDWKPKRNLTGGQVIWYPPSTYDSTLS